MTTEQRGPLEVKDSDVALLDAIETQLQAKENDPYFPSLLVCCYGIEPGIDQIRPVREFHTGTEINH